MFLIDIIWYVLYSELDCRTLWEHLELDLILKNALL